MAAELDLAHIPAKLVGLSAKMSKVFKSIYKEFSTHIGGIREVIFVMPEGARLRFMSTAEGLASYPHKEIELEPSDDEPGAIDLIHIGRSAELSGVVATNHAITIAAALGATTLNIMDSAYIKCNDAVHTFPLSLYRIITGVGSGAGWYTNIGLKRGLTANNSVGRALNFRAALERVCAIKLAEPLAFFGAALKMVRGGDALGYAERSMDKTGAHWESNIQINATNKPNIIETYTRVISILEGAEPVLLVDFLKNEAVSCIDKSIILRSFPGYNGRNVSPTILLNGAGEKILEFSYIDEFLRIRTVLQNTVLKLRGGGGAAAAYGSVGGRRKTRRHLR